MTQRDSTPPTQHFSHAFQPAGRFAITGDGFLQQQTGDRIDPTDWVAGRSPDVQYMPIHTNLKRASGLLHGGIAVVDRRRKPKLHDLLAVRFNGDLIMRRLERRHNLYCFVADDPREAVCYVTPESKVERLGVITHAINPIGAALGAG